MKLLSEKKNFKTAKNVGFISGELSLAPANTSGYNVCANASQGCKKACIGWFSGCNVMATPRKAKIRKTKMFFEQRELFFADLISDLEFLARKGKRLNMPVCVRLNCYSDLPWENFKIEGLTIFEMFPEIQFYDYTALKNRFKQKLPNNYHLTFSRKENNDKTVNSVLGKGVNVAVVFNKLPETYKGKKVIDGDKTDLRFLDAKNVIVGLVPKGKGKKDTTGFII